METLAAYIPRDRQQAMLRGEELPDRMHGAVLFADISGFTPLADALVRALGGRRGAEELTRTLNVVYDALIAEVEGCGGSVVAFSGDAITCWFDADRGQRAVACALGARQAVSRVAHVQVPSGATVSLALKTAVASGAVRRFRVGDPNIQYIDVLAGATLDRVAVAERLARHNDAVLAPEVAERLAGQVSVAEWRADAETGTRFAVLGGRHERQDAASPATPPAPSPGSLSEKELRPWLLPPVYERLKAGQGEFVAEFRSAVALFLHFSGLDYDGDDAAGQKLDAYVRWVQNSLARHGGYLIQLTTGDKGNYLFAAFGAPLAQGDEAARAVAAALDLRSPPADLAYMGQASIGLSQGRMRVGPYGSTWRRTYGVLGSEVNIAARLMSQAAPGQILASRRVVEAASKRFEFDVDYLADMQVKGRPEPVPAYSLAGRRPLSPARPEVSQPLPARRQPSLVGRAAERALLAEQLQALRQGGPGGAVLVEGDAGIGKSRLVADLLEQARTLRVTSLLGAGDAVEKSTAYHAWRLPFRQLFSLDPMSEVDSQAVLSALSADPDLLRLAPLLNAVLPLGLEDNPITSQMTGQVRSDNTHAFLGSLLQVAAARSPTLLVLEDAHWFDSASWALVQYVSQWVSPLLLVVTARPLSEPPPAEYTQLVQQPATHRLLLEALSPDEAVALVSQRLGVAGLPEPVAALIRTRAEGHPFFSEELAYALRDAGFIRIVDGRCELASGVTDLSRVSLPDNVAGVITSRVDRLAPSEQLTLKVASVIGRAFALSTLCDVHPILEDRPHVEAHLGAAERLDIARLDSPPPEPSYSFKHVITQEVVYNMLLFSQRRELHRSVAEWYERAYAGDLSPFYPLLAYHWRMADVTAQAVDYLEQAGQQALRSYANQEAVRFFSEALALDAGLTHAPNGSSLALDGSATRPATGGDGLSLAPGGSTTRPEQSPLRRGRWQRLLGDAYKGLGNMGEAQAHYEQALATLGEPVPVTKPQMVGSLLRQVLSQVLHRLRPGWFARPAPAGEAQRMAEAARANAQLTLMYYLANDNAAFLNATLTALNLAERLPVSDVLAEGYATLCVLMGLAGRLSWAEAYAGMAMRAARALNTPWILGTVLVRLGVYRAGIGQWQQGQMETEQAIAHFEAVQDWRGWGDSVNVLHRLLHLHGEYAASGEWSAQLYTRAERNGNAQHVGWGREVAGSNFLRQGRLEEAIAHLEAAAGAYGQILTPSDEWSMGALLALAYWRAGHAELAKPLAERALKLIKDATPAQFARLSSYFSLAEVYLEGWALEARSEELAERARLAVKLLHRFARYFPIGRPAAWLCQGTLDWLEEKHVSARAAWQKSLAFSEKLDMPYEAGRAHYELGRHLPAGDPAAVEHLRCAEELLTRVGAGYELEELCTLLSAKTMTVS